MEPLLIIAGVALAGGLVLASRAPGPWRPTNEQLRDWLAQAFDPRPVSARVTIRYVNRKGEDVRRTVRVAEVSAGVPEFSSFLAWCETARAPRTFRFDSVLEARDTRTRQPIANLYGHLVRLADEQASAADRRPLRHFDDVTVPLVYLAREDGLIAPEEAVLLRDYLALLTYTPDLEPGRVMAAVRRLTRERVTRSRAFDAIRRVADEDVVDLIVLREVAHSMASLGDPDSRRARELIAQLPS